MVGQPTREGKLTHPSGAEVISRGCQRSPHRTWKKKAGGRHLVELPSGKLPPTPAADRTTKNDQTLPFICVYALYCASSSLCPCEELAAAEPRVGCDL